MRRHVPRAAAERRGPDQAARCGGGDRLRLPHDVRHVRVSRADFADKLGEMREWLDRQNSPLVRFETAGDGDTINILVQFDGDDLAEQFGQDS